MLSNISYKTQGSEVAAIIFEKYGDEEKPFELRTGERMRAHEDYIQVTIPGANANTMGYYPGSDEVRLFKGMDNILSAVYKEFPELNLEDLVFDGSPFHTRYRADFGNWGYGEIPDSFPQADRTEAQAFRSAINRLKQL